MKTRKMRQAKREKMIPAEDEIPYAEMDEFEELYQVVGYVDDGNANDICHHLEGLYFYTDDLTMSAFDRMPYP